MHGNPILTGTNTFIGVTNWPGGPTVLNELSGLPLTTSDGSATGQICLAVKTVGSGSGTSGVYSNAAIATASVTTGDSVVLASNLARKYATFGNPSTTETVYLNFGDAASAGEGVMIGPGQSYEMTGANLFNGEVHGIGTGSVSLATLEGT